VASSRIITDPHTFNVYGTPGPGLGSIESESDSHADLADDELLAGIHNVIYRATSQAFREYQNALGKHEKHRKGNFSGGCKLASCLFTSTRTNENHV
jgi:hypothetical protein